MDENLEIVLRQIIRLNRRIDKAVSSDMSDDEGQRVMRYLNCRHNNLTKNAKSYAKSLGLTDSQLSFCKNRVESIIDRE
jgi:hypothetical protein